MVTTKIKVSAPAQKNLQRKIYEYMKHKAYSYEGPLSPEFRKYRLNQQKHSTRKFKPARIQDLVHAIEQSHVVYLGDFHSFDQSSKNLERLLKILMKHKQKLSLGVEFVHEVHQEQIDQYLNHHLTEMEFLEAIDYKESWRFPWTYYQVFFELARNHKIEIIALNSPGRLIERDQKASQLIADHLHDKKDAIMLVLFGEYHIVPNKLPALVAKKMNPELRQTIIHQNLDDVYWKLKQSKITPKMSLGSLVQFNEFEFSLQTSPPWIKYESMIYWYENFIEDPNFDMHEYLLDTGFLAFNSSVPDTFHYLTKAIAESLGLKSNYPFDDFNIYDHQKLKLIEKKISSLRPVSIRQLYEHYLYKGKKFKLPGSRTYYCSSYSINRISYLAGFQLFDFIGTKQRVDYEDQLLKGNVSAKFIFLTCRFAMGYLSSKIINPFLKCDLYQDYLVALQSPKTSKQKKNNLRLVKKIIDDSEDNSLDLKSSLKGKSILVIHYCSEAIGHMIADLLYDRQLKTQHKNALKVIELITKIDTEESRFVEIMKLLKPRTGFKSLKKRLF
jgi:uncharacterized iron-regulated protein